MEKDWLEMLAEALFKGIVHMIIALLAAGFIAITFLQSAMDKMFDYKGNLSFMKEQFSKTFLKNMIGVLLPVLLVFELLTGVICGIGAIFICCNARDNNFMLLGFFLSGITLLMLLFGQRVSKQYPGAVSLTGYFIITLIGMLALASSI